MSIEDSVSEFHERPELLRKRARAEFIRWVFIALWTVLIAATLTAVLFSLQTATEQRDRLIDCTTPQGKCFEENNERTGKVVAAIVDSTIERARPLHVTTRKVAALAAFCADKPGSQTAQQIQDCIENAMEEE